MTTAPPAPAIERESWLRATGPHALLRTVRAGSDAVVLALSIRPGTLTNSLTRIALRFSEPGGSEVHHDLPVFPLYSRQWSIDLTVGLPTVSFSASPSWSAEVLLEDAESRSVLPLLQARPAAFSLGEFPEVGALASAWTLEPAER